jgi:hypothetical protein
LGRHSEWWTAGIALVVVLLGAALGSAQVLDTVLAQVDGRTIASSDIALARALGVFGFAPTSAPIERGDVERFADVMLIIAEAGRTAIAIEAAPVDRAWGALAARVGGEAALDRWLEERAIDRDWARRFVQDDLVRTAYFDARFASFVFPDEDAVSQALGPGPHDEGEREAERQRLIQAAALKAQAEWLQGARKRASIRILLAPGTSVAAPFPPPERDGVPAGR